MLDRSSDKLMDKSKTGKVNLEVEEVDDRQGFGDVHCVPVGHPLDMQIRRGKLEPTQTE